MLVTGNAGKRFPERMGPQWAFMTEREWMDIANRNALERERFAGLARELLEMLRRLANEANGFLSMADPETHGYTNTAILRQQIGAARALIAKAEGAE